MEHEVSGVSGVSAADRDVDRLVSQERILDVPLEVGRVDCWPAWRGRAVWRGRAWASWRSVRSCRVLGRLVGWSSVWCAGQGRPVAPAVVDRRPRSARVGGAGRGVGQGTSLHGSTARLTAERSFDSASLALSIAPDEASTVTSDARARGTGVLVRIPRVAGGGPPPCPRSTRADRRAFSLPSESAANRAGTLSTDAPDDEVAGLFRPRHVGARGSRKRSRSSSDAVGPTRLAPHSLTTVGPLTMRTWFSPTW
jgi:hypothetical protein